MKTTLIKIFTIVMTMTFCMNFTIYGRNDSDKESKIRVILKKAHKTFTIDRSLEADVSATYYIDMEYIELVCNGTKETDVYIVNPKGEEFSFDTFDSGMTPCYMVDVPQIPGMYYIIIDSSVMYAEGTFVVE